MNEEFKRPKCVVGDHPADIQEEGVNFCAFHFLVWKNTVGGGEKKRINERRFRR